jgi:hypothetical protein
MNFTGVPTECLGEDSLYSEIDSDGMNVLLRTSANEFGSRIGRPLLQVRRELVALLLGSAWRSPQVGAVEALDGAQPLTKLNLCLGKKPEAASDSVNSRIVESQPLSNFDAVNAPLEVESDRDGSG